MIEKTEWLELKIEEANGRITELVSRIAQCEEQICYLTSMQKGVGGEGDE